MNKNTIKISAPGKLMLFGEHSVIYGEPCIVTAVDQRIFAAITKTNDNIIRISAPEVKVKNYSIKVSDLGKIEYPREVRFVLSAVENFFNKYKITSGLKISTYSQFASIFGFGSSSAVTICIIKGLSELFDIKVSNKVMFDIAYKTVLCVQGVGSGFDLAVALRGGTIYFIKGGKTMTPILTKNLSLVVGYTGIKADTATLVKKVEKLYKKDKNNIGKIFSSITTIVNKSQKALTDGNLVELGNLMQENQFCLGKLKVSIPKLDKMISAAVEAGAYGAKLSGAGGGDCMIALVDKRSMKNVKNAIKGVGGTILDVKFNAKGAKIEK